MALLLSPECSMLSLLCAFFWPSGQRPWEQTRVAEVGAGQPEVLGEVRAGPESCGRGTWEASGLRALELVRSWGLHSQWTPLWTQVHVPFKSTVECGDHLFGKELLEPPKPLLGKGCGARGVRSWTSTVPRRAAWG